MLTAYELGRLSIKLAADPTFRKPDTVMPSIPGASTPKPPVTPYAPSPKSGPGGGRENWDYAPQQAKTQQTTPVTPVTPQSSNASGSFRDVVDGTLNPAVQQTPSNATKNRGLTAPLSLLAPINLARGTASAIAGDANLPAFKYDYGGRIMYNDLYKSPERSRMAQLLSRVNNANEAAHINFARNDYNKDVAAGKINPRITPFTVGYYEQNYGLMGKKQRLPELTLNDLYALNYVPSALPANPKLKSYFYPNFKDGTLPKVQHFLQNPFDPYDQLSADQKYFFNVASKFRTPSAAVRLVETLNNLRYPQEAPSSARREIDKLPFARPEFYFENNIEARNLQNKVLNPTPDNPYFNSPVNPATGRMQLDDEAFKRFFADVANQRKFPKSFKAFQNPTIQ